MFDPQTYSPLSEFVRDSKGHVSRLKATKVPEVLTVDGRAEVVVQDAESYQKLVDELQQARLVESLVQAENDYEAGRGRPAYEFFAKLKTNHGRV